MRSCNLAFDRLSIRHLFHIKELDRRQKEQALAFRRSPPWTRSVEKVKYFGV